MKSCFLILLFLLATLAGNDTINLCTKFFLHQLAEKVNLNRKDHLKRDNKSDCTLLNGKFNTEALDVLGLNPLPLSQFLNPFSY